MPKSFFSDAVIILNSIRGNSLPYFALSSGATSSPAALTDAHKDTGSSEGNQQKSPLVMVHSIQPPADQNAVERPSLSTHSEAETAAFVGDFSFSFLFS